VEAYSWGVSIFLMPTASELKGSSFVFLMPTALEARETVPDL
jgi:hypothetical protein